MIESVFKIIRGIVGLRSINRTDAADVTVTANGQTSSLDMSGFGCLSYSISVDSVSGTNPTLQVELEASDDGTNWNHVHSSLQFTASSTQRLSGVRITAKYYRFRYIVGGTTPSFDVTVVTTLKSYLPTRTGSLFRFSDVDLTATNNVSTVFSAFSNENVSCVLIRGADGGTPANIRFQGSNDSINWIDLTTNIQASASTSVLQTFSTQAIRFYRITVTTASSAGTRVLNVFWNSNGGGA